MRTPSETYIFRSNWRGLAPLGPSARPDKFINLATLGPSALASRGNKLDCYLQSFIKKGYDDLEEIIQMSDDLLTQLTTDVGMITKPNHVHRLRCGVASMKAETICPAGDGDKPETSRKVRYKTLQEKQFYFLDGCLAYQK